MNIQTKAFTSYSGPSLPSPWSGLRLTWIRQGSLVTRAFTRIM